MLARSNRVTRGEDYQRIIRRGRRVGARGLVVTVERAWSPSTPTRFGFIITKRVGVAVVRNTLRRRLKAICRDQLAAYPVGYDVIVRVQPEAAGFDFDRLRECVVFGMGAAISDLERRRPVPAP